MKYLMLAALCILSVTVFSQDRTIIGKITASSGGDPIQGANVAVKGKRIGTVSDALGKFEIKANNGDKIIVSFSGYLQKEFSVQNGNSEVSISLDDDLQKLSDVVVVGYGTQRKADMTGAATTIKGDRIASVPVVSFDAALQGRAPGVQVSQQGGSPGSAIRVQVRGTSSVSSGTEPLYVIDGIIIYQDIAGITDGRTSNVLNPLASINTGDIESIEVLKDAAATAIYGSRGANGVVLVTTKTGRKGQSRTNIDFNRGISRATNLIDYTSGSQWLSLVDQARSNSVGYGITSGQQKFDPLTLVSNTLPTNGVSGAQFGPLTTWTRTVAEATNTNWRDHMLQEGQLTDLNFSASNGFEKGGFYISGQYRDETGVVVNHRLQRFSVRSNLDFAISSKVKAGAKMQFSYLKFNQPQLGIGNNGGGVGRQNFGATGGWGQANNGALPIMPVYNPDGTYFNPLRGTNTVAGSDPANFISVQEQNRFLGNVFLEYQMIPSLALRVEGSGDFLNSNSIYWANDVIRYSKVGQEQGRYLKFYSTNAYLTYTKKFGSHHDLTATAGSEIQKTSTRRQDYAFEGISGNGQEIGEIATGTQFITAVSGIFPDRNFTSYFGRANYKYKNKYLLGLSFRRDGSTAFGPENRYGNFPAASAGWIISNEDFFTKSNVLGAFNFFKLRASYGQTGNANIPSFAFLNNYVNWPVYGQSSAYGFSVLANPDIGWEKNSQFDVAVEFALWNNRLRGSVDYFHRTSQDMLLNVPVAPNVGIGAGSQSVITNIGDLVNKGVEIELSSLNVGANSSNGGFRWTTDFNITFIKNNISKLTPQYYNLPAGNAPIANGIQQGVGITQVGGILGSYYIAEYAGIDAQGFETIYEVDKGALTKTGKTVRTGNIVRATQTNINNNRMVFENKSGLPTWYGGITNTLSYKGIDLLFLFTYQGGNYIYDGLEEATSYVRTGSNVIREDVFGNTWTPTNTNAKYPILTWNLRDQTSVNGSPAPQTMGTRTSRYLYKGDFLRLKTLQLGYSFPAPMVKKLRLQNIRVYGNVQNLLTFTSYPGFDPETINLGSSTQDRNLSQGFLSATPVPQVITFNAGINVSF